MTRTNAEALREAYQSEVGKPLSKSAPFSDFVITEIFVQYYGDRYHVRLKAHCKRNDEQTEGFLLAYIRDNNIPIDRNKFGLTPDMEY